MQRIIFFVLLVGGIAAASCLVLFSSLDGQSWIAASGTVLDHLKDVFESIKSSEWAWSTVDANAIFTYGVIMFLFINAILLLSLLVMALTTFFKLSKVYRFYATSWWHLAAALVFTGAVAYILLGRGDFGSAIGSLPWTYYVPVAVSCIIVILSFIFKRAESNN